MKNEWIARFLLILMLAAVLCSVVSCNAVADEPVESGESTDTGNEQPVGSIGSEQGSIRSGTQASGYTMYLKLDGIEGEATSSKHQKEIVVLDFKTGAQSDTALDSAGSGGTFEPFVFVHPVDKATPNLQQYCLVGKKISTATLSVCTSIAGLETVVFKIVLDRIKITNAVIEYDEESGMLLETVSLAADKMTWTVISIGLDNSIGGKTEANFDQSKKA